MLAFFDVINGRPVHVLLLHLPVVLVPAMAIIALILLFKPEWRLKYGKYFVISLFVTAILTYLTSESGEALDEYTNGKFNIEEHAELAETATLLTFGFFLTALGSFMFDRKNKFEDSKPQIARLISVVVAVFGILATIWLVRAGEAGVDSVWSGRI